MVDVNVKDAGSGYWVDFLDHGRTITSVFIPRVTSKENLQSLVIALLASLCRAS